MSADERPTLIAYDGSDDARHAIERAAELLPGRPVAVLHVWRPMAAARGALLGISRAEAEGGRARLNEEAAAESARIAAEGAQLAAAAGLRADRLSAPDAGSPAQAIVAVAQERDAAVVVVGARGLSEIRSALLGSVSTDVVRHARQPVLVVSRHDERTPHTEVVPLATPVEQHS